jgi:alpha-glucosidase (family GH31 glycosyl hydrolase)
MTWNKNFNGIEEFIENLDEKSRNLVVIIDPHIKVDKSYFVYKGAYDQSNYIYYSRFFHYKRK